MLISKTLRPLLSNKTYKSDARRKMQEYNLDTCTFLILNDLFFFNCCK